MTDIVEKLRGPDQLLQFVSGSTNSIWILHGSHNARHGAKL